MQYIAQYMFIINYGSSHSSIVQGCAAVVGRLSFTKCAEHHFIRSLFKEVPHFVIRFGLLWIKSHLQHEQELEPTLLGMNTYSVMRQRTPRK